MIIGNVSIDPRTVLDFEYDARSHIVDIDIRTGDALRTVSARFDDVEDAMSAMVELDKACYKGPLTDAISDKDIDDGDIDELTITDKLIERLR